MSRNDTDIIILIKEALQYHANSVANIQKYRTTVRKVPLSEINKKSKIKSAVIDTKTDIPSHKVTWKNIKGAKI